MTYEPTLASIRAHPLPQWYDDAKLGIFIHWGLYSVPAWAPRTTDVQTLYRERGPGYLLRNSPYAEWYWNSMQIPGSPTARHHGEVWGADFPYDEFVPIFDERSGSADLGELADLCAGSGAGYVVLTTKHHDGFCLWRTQVPHPRRGAYRARRDLVGELTEQVRAAGLRMGLYYSGGYDWSYQPTVMATIADALGAVPQDPTYADYVERHLRELIARYRPSMLWNDIGLPPGVDFPALVADYYNSVEDGLVNDRWSPLREPTGTVGRTLLRAAAGGAERAWRLLPGQLRQIPIRSGPHHDVTTPEYATHDEVVDRKWEATRGVGHSFGANHAERPEDIISGTELVHLLVDVVSKNGNLLIGVGPDAWGRIPEPQQAPLQVLGAWMSANGSAVRATRPWVVAQAVTSEAQPVRFTRSADALHAILVGGPPRRSFVIDAIDATGVRSVTLLGEPVEWSVDAGRLRVVLPERLPLSPAHVLRIEPVPPARTPARRAA